MTVRGILIVLLSQYFVRVYVSYHSLEILPSYPLTRHSSAQVPNFNKQCLVTLVLPLVVKLVGNLQSPLQC